MKLSGKQKYFFLMWIIKYLLYFFDTHIIWPGWQDQGDLKEPSSWVFTTFSGSSWKTHSPLASMKIDNKAKENIMKLVLTSIKLSPI